MEPKRIRGAIAAYDLIRMGNLSPEYLAPNFRIESRGLCFDLTESPSPNWVIKDYALHKEGAKKEEIVSPDELRKFLSEQFRENKLEKGLGLGFSITSNGMTNLSLWRKDFPHLPLQTIWTIKEGVWQPKSDANQDNSYCTGEGLVYAFERNAWSRFLESPRSERRKEEYLETTFGK